MDYLESPQYSSEFWINNFQYEIFYDLDRRCCTQLEEQIKYNDELCLIHQMKEDNSTACMKIDDLPTEILSHIFSYLTAFELLVVRDVCTLWSNIVAQDKCLWNHVHFSSADLDVKTTASLLKEMPLLRSAHLCNVHSSDDMTRLITVLCDVCWDLREIHFPGTCDWHPSPMDLHTLSYYHPRVSSLHLSTKQKLTSDELANIGSVLSHFSCLTDLELVGFYWYQAELVPSFLGEIKHLRSLALPSLPGLTALELIQLLSQQPHLEIFTVNTSSLSGKNANLIRHLSRIKTVRVIDNSKMSSEKLNFIENIVGVKDLDVNLSDSVKEEILDFFKKPRKNLLRLRVSNCEYSDKLLHNISEGCTNLTELQVLNPKDTTGEVTDDGILAITKLKSIQLLEVKSRSVTRAHYSALAEMRNLKYARINGMRIPGCS